MKGKIISLQKKSKSLNYYTKVTFKKLWSLIRREIHFHRLRPTEALFFLTYRCTSSCRTCEMWKRLPATKTERELDLTGWKKAVDMVHSLNIKKIYLFGGDALLRSDILGPLIKYIHSKNVVSDLTTNANLLDQEMASMLLSSGVEEVWISVDSVGEVHDQIRGSKGTFERARKGFENLLKARDGNLKQKIGLNCTVSTLNFENFETVLPFAINLGIDVVHFEYVGEVTPEVVEKSSINGLIPNPYFINKGPSLLLNRKQALLFKEKIEQLKRLARLKAFSINTGNVDCLNLKHLTTGLYPVRKCYMGRYHINIDPYGNVIPCLFFENYHLGNIKLENLCQIWGNKKHKIFLKNVDNNKIEMCKHCVIGIQRNPSFFQSLNRHFAAQLTLAKGNLPRFVL